MKKLLSCIVLTGVVVLLGCDQNKKLSLPALAPAGSLTLYSASVTSVSSVIGNTKKTAPGLNPGLYSAQVRRKDFHLTRYSVSCRITCLATPHDLADQSQADQQHGVGFRLWHGGCDGLRDGEGALHRPALCSGRR